MRHHLERGEDGRYHCPICLWSWAGRASSIKTYCPGVPRYAGYERMPDHLKTFTMLRKAGLKTEAQPAGCIYIQSRKEWVWLYDERQATPRRKASAAQRAVLAKGRATQLSNVTCQECGHVGQGKEERRQIRRDHLCEFCWQDVTWRQDHNAAIQLARTPLEQEVVVLDTETTGLERDDVVIEVAVLAKDGTVLLDTFIQTATPIGDEAQALHGIQPEVLADAPPFAEVWPRLRALFSEHPVIIYNAAFDCRMLRHTAKQAQLSIPENWHEHTHCLMEMYAAFMGSMRSDGSYGWWSLRAACEQEKIEALYHRAKDDAEAALALLKALAAKEELPERSTRVLPAGSEASA